MDDAECNTATISTIGTRIIMKTPKYRIIPIHNSCSTLFSLQEKRWWGWKELEKKSHMIAIETIKHLIKTPEYFDENGNEIESC